jgi:hypothetical protein
MTEVRTGRLIPYLNEMFRLQAWMAMGKIANPMSGKVERDLDTARAMIDLLVELESRTEGNRSTEETRILQGTLTELRLNYVDEMKRPVEPAAPSEPAAPGEPTAGAAPESGPGVAPESGPGAA